jgi:hypothetical protein
MRFLLKLFTCVLLRRYLVVMVAGVSLALR